MDWNKEYCSEIKNLTRFSDSLISSVFVSFSSTWSKNRLSKKKLFLHDVNPSFNFWPALFWVSLFPVVFSSELPSPRPTKSITEALKSNVMCNSMSTCVYCWLHKHWCKKDLILYMSIKGKFKGMPVQTQQFLVQFQGMFVKFFPVFAQLYLMRHVWLPTTQGMSCSMLAELTGTTLSWISSEQVMFVATLPKQGNLLMEGKEDTGS